MQNVTEQFKTAIRQLSREMKSRVTFPDLILDDTVIQRIEWDSTLIGMDDFEIGTAPMDMVRITLISEQPINYKFDDTECNIELGLNVVQYSDTSHLALSEFTYDELSYRTHGDMAVTSEEYVSLGLYTVEKTTKKGNVITLECIDRMYKFEKPYISSLTYPATLLQIAQDICSVAGVVLATDVFPNSGYTVNTKPVLTDVTCRVAISQIAELAGGYARIARDGKLEIFNVKATALTQAKYAGYNLGDTLLADELIINDIEITGDNYIDFANKELPVAMIDKVIVKVGEVEAVKGAGDNPYYIKDNLFCQNPSAVVDDLYSVLNELSYIPFTMKWQGNPAIDCGDAVTIYTKAGYYNTLVTRRSLVYTGGLREDYEAVGKSNVEKESTPKGSLTIDTEKAKVDIRRLEGEVSSKVSKGNIISEINQTAETIKIQSNKINLVGAVTVLSDITGNLGSITAGTITGVTVRTSAGSNRIQLTNSVLEAYLNNIKRVQLDYDSLDFYNKNGTLVGVLQGIYEDNLNQMRIHSTEIVSLLASVNQTDFYETRASVNVERYEDTSSVVAYSQDKLGTNISMAYLTPTTFEVMAQDTNIIGDFTVSYGTKAAVVETEDYGRRKLYALETPDNRFVSYIETTLDIGEHYIEIEPMFMQTISDYFVVPHIQNMASVSIIERQESGFLVVVENKPAQVVFEINGKRKGFESIYMEEVTQDEQGTRQNMREIRQKAIAKSVAISQQSGI